VRLFEDGQWQELLGRDHFGPEVGFAQAIAPAFPHDRIVLCKVARGGGNLFYDWNPDGISRGPEDEYRGPLYPKLTSALASLRDQLASENEDAAVSALIWMQGERDSVFEFMAESYAGNLAAFIAAVRRDTGNARLPVILIQIAPRVYRLEDGRFQHAFRRTVQAAQQAVAAADPMVTLVETTDLPQCDNLHFDTGGQLELGKRCAEALVSTVRGYRQRRREEPE
jgi:hypothetical protein